MEDGPVDLRMNPNSGVPISEWLMSATKEEARRMPACGPFASPG